MFAEARQSALTVRAQLLERPRALSDLADRLRASPPPFVMTCARGSSDNAATYAKYLIETALGIPVASHAPSVSSLSATRWRDLRGVLFIAISQSGRSPDLVASARAAREAGALVLAIVNDEESPLAAGADVVAAMRAGPERSVAATKSFVGALAAVALLVADWTRDAALARALEGLPSALEEAWNLDWSQALPTIVAARNMYVVGRGLNLGVAAEVALKLKETCGLHAEAFSAAEVRHGPMAIVNAGFPLLMLEPTGVAATGFDTLAHEMAARGAHVLWARPGGSAAPSGGAGGPVHLAGVGPLHEAVAPIAAAVAAYRLIAEASVARGLDPDAPPHLSKVTETL